MHRAPRHTRVMVDLCTRNVTCVAVTAIILVGCSGGRSTSVPSVPSQVTTAGSSGTPIATARLRAARPARDTVTAAAARARTAFWDAFRSERYEELPGVLRQLNIAVLENPHDAETVLLLGHAHLWKVGERARAATADPTVTEHLVLAEHYFEDAYRLSPDDHRILGWLASTRGPLAAIRQDSARAAESAQLMHEAVSRYPAFNLFTAAYTRSALPVHDPRFREAIEMLWRNVDACSGVRTGADAAADTAQQVYARAQRADRSCANTAKAPHNFEGFVMHLGDMLVRRADADGARAVYARAQSAPSYAQWPYRALLEARLRDVDANVARAHQGQPTPMMAGSAYSCAGCHAQQSQPK